VARKWNLEQLTEENLKAQIEKAREAGKKADAVEPRAESVSYSAPDNLITILLKNGAVFSFPPTLVQGLADATPEGIADFLVTGEGRSIRWDSLDIDFSIPSLVANIFGTKEWMAELGRQGGLRISPAKADAVRKNGAKGGRPKKSELTDKFEIAQKILDSETNILEATQQALEGSPQKKLPEN